MPSAIVFAIAPRVEGEMLRLGLGFTISIAPWLLSAVEGPRRRRVCDVTLPGSSHLNVDGFVGP